MSESEMFSLKESSDMLKHIVKHMVTREDVEQIVGHAIAESEKRMTTTMTESIGKTKHDLMVHVEKEVGKVNTKIDGLTTVLEKREVISPAEAQRVKALA